MPKTWYDWKAVAAIEDPKQQKLYRDVIAAKKPYFMRYIYPTLRKEYNQYIQNTDKSALREFGKTVQELASTPYGELTERQKEFLRYFNNGIPVGMGDCVMNKICRIFEREFDCFVSKYLSDVHFDHRVMQSGAAYSKPLYYKIKQIFEAYMKRVKNYAVTCKYENIDQYDRQSALNMMLEDFMKECLCVCSNEDTLNDILIDVFYSKNSVNKLAYAICGDAAVRNLLRRNGNKISFPVQDPDGDIEYGGKRFRIETVLLEEEEEDHGEYYIE